MYLFGLTYANGTGSLVSSDFKRSTTCRLRLGGMGSSKDKHLLYNSGPVGPLYASPSGGPIMLQWDDENCSPEKMSSIKQSQSSGSMASLRRVFRTLSRPQVCANLACMRNSRTKKTCSWRACAGISTS